MWPFNKKKLGSSESVPSQIFNGTSKKVDESKLLDDTIKNIDIEVANKKSEISNMILESLVNDIDSYKETFVEVCNGQEDYSSKNRELKSYWTINRSESSLSSKIKLEKKGDDGVGISILFNYESGYSDEKKWLLRSIEFSEMKDYRKFRYLIYSSDFGIYQNILYQYYKQFFLLSKNKELADVKFNYDKVTNLIGKKSRRGAKLNSIIND